MKNRSLRLLAALNFALTSCRSTRVQVPNAEAEIAIAEAAHEKCDFRDALVHAQNAVALAPKMTKAHLAVATFADDLCLPNAQPGPDDRICGLAVDEYRHTLELDPSYGEALRNLAYLLYQFNRLDESESYYRKALALHPDDPELMGGVAALDYVRIAPDVIGTKARLGLGRKKTLIQSAACAEVRDRNRARFDEAMALLTRAEQIRSNNSELKAYLGALYRVRAEIQCGDTANYQADMKDSRAWYIAGQDSAAKSRQEFFQKVPGAPPAPPDIQ